MQRQRSTETVPPIWRELMARLNQKSYGRVPDGTPGLRDVNAPCYAFEPGEAVNGQCSTDGHYMCAECVHITQSEIWYRQERCTVCGAKLVKSIHWALDCPNDCTDPYGWRGGP